MKVRDVVAALALTAGVLAGATTAGGAGAASLSMTPPSQVVGTSAGTVSVQVAISDVTNLGAFEFRLSYDPGVLTFDSVTGTGFLASTGRSVKCPQPILAEGSVLYGCASSGYPLPGADGDGLLGTVTFRPKGSGVSSLVFTKIELADASDDALPIVLGDFDTAVIKVTAPGGSGGSGGTSGGGTQLEPTPTPNAALLTPTAIPNAPTPTTGETLPDTTGAGGSAGAGTPTASDVVSGGGGETTSGSEPTSGAGSGGGGMLGRFPVAGYGYARDAYLELGATARLGLVLGLAFICAGFLLRRTALRRR